MTVVAHRWQKSAKRRLQTAEGREALIFGINECIDFRGQ